MRGEWKLGCWWGSSARASWVGQRKLHEEVGCFRHGHYFGDSGADVQSVVRRKTNPLPEMLHCINSIVGLSSVISAGMAQTKDGRVLKASHIEVRIFAGRRAFMSTDDMLAREELKQFDVKLRTYDQLIEWVGTLFP
jgi:hypothetical protein